MDRQLRCLSEHRPKQFPSGLRYKRPVPPSMGLGRQRARFSIPLLEPVDKVVRNPKPLGRLPHRFVVQILYDPFPYIHRIGSHCILNTFSILVSPFQDTLKLHSNRVASALSVTASNKNSPGPQSGPLQLWTAPGNSTLYLVWIDY